MSRKQKKKSIQFECSAPEATAAFLAGTFNDWNTADTPMSKDDNGHWCVDLDLPPGRYEFKFFIDGDWCCDPGSDGTSECPMCFNGYGTMNRVIEVE